MRFTRFKTTAMACIMAASMAVPGMTAMAADAQKAPYTIKTVKANENVDGIPDADKTITFHITQIDNIDEVKAPDTKTITDKTYDVSKAKGASTEFNTQQLLSEEERKSLKTGEYTFLVTEEQNIKSSTDFGWTYVSNKQYRMQVLVSRETDGNGEYVKTWKITEYSDTDTKDSVSSKAKFDNTAFENTYNKKSEGPDPNPDPDHPNTPKTYELAVGKTVTNSTYVDRNQLYEVEVVITVPTTTGKDESGNYVITDNAYTVALTCADHDALEEGEAACGYTRTVDKTNGTITYVATYRDGDKITISNIAVGATYTVKENKTDSLPNWTGVKYNSSKGGTFEGVDSFTAQTFVQGDASVDVQNTFADTPSTGVTTTIAPYLTLVAFAIAAVAAYVVLKRRMAR